jgi:tetratricopeptide (TPR) repeat protein
MKTKKREQRSASTVKVAVREPSRAWLYWAAAAAALLVVFWAYGPALHGPFLFDDTVLPFALPGFAEPLRNWIRGPRPVLMTSYWVNATLSRDDPFSYHVVNVLAHCLTSGFIFLIARRLLEWAGTGRPKRDLLAGFAGALFLLHPAQTEAVAYLAGRSESLSVMFVFAAFTLFLYRRQQAASWGLTAAVLALFGLALLSKEHTVVLPALLLLTDYWWNPGFSLRGIGANRKLYLAIAAAALGGVAYFWGLITKATTAGFGLKDFTWYQYFFTQCRALFVYIGMFLLPANLTADWDFPVSKTILDRGAIVGLIALVALAVAAWIYRRKFPLASYGFFVYLLLMAPTSSILPIQDTIAERRLYFSMLGLILIVLEFLRRLRVDRKALATACAAVVLIEAAVTHARAAVWSSPVALWEDTVQKSPNKSRGHFQLGLAYFDVQRYDRSIAEYQRAAALKLPTYDLYIDWALALNKAGRNEEALQKLHAAARIDRSAHVYSQIAMVYGTMQRYAEGLAALDEGQKIDANYPWIYIYRGKIHVRTNQLAEAVADYNHALQLDPRNAEAISDLGFVQKMLRQQQTGR